MVALGRWDTHDETQSREARGGQAGVGGGGVQARACGGSFPGEGHQGRAQVRSCRSGSPEEPVLGIKGSAEDRNSMGQARQASRAGLGVRHGVWKSSALPWLRPQR